MSTALQQDLIMHRTTGAAGGGQDSPGQAQHRTSTPDITGTGLLAADLSPAGLSSSLVHHKKHVSLSGQPHPAGLDAAGAAKVGAGAGAGATWARSAAAAAAALEPAGILPMSHADEGDACVGSHTGQVSESNASTSSLPETKTTAGSGPGAGLAASTSASASPVGDESVLEVYEAPDSPQPAGAAKACLVHATGMWHHAVHVWVVDKPDAASASAGGSGGGRVLLRRRAQGLPVCPDMWDVSASACVTPGESVEECAVRALRCCLGMTYGPASPELTGPLSMARGGTHTFEATLPGAYKLAQRVEVFVMRAPGSSSSSSGGGGGDDEYGSAGGGGGGGSEAAGVGPMHLPISMPMGGAADAALGGNEAPVARSGGGGGGSSHEVSHEAQEAVVGGAGAVSSLLGPTAEMPDVAQVTSEAAFMTPAQVRALAAASAPAPAGAGGLPDDTFCPWIKYELTQLEQYIQLA